MCFRFLGFSYFEKKFVFKSNQVTYQMKEQLKSNVYEVFICNLTQL